MASLKRNGESICEKCGAQNRRSSIRRRREKRLAGTLLFSMSQLFNNASTSIDLSYRQETQCIATQKANNCQELGENFPNFNTIRQHKTQRKDLWQNLKQQVTLQALKMDDLDDNNL